MYFLCNVTYEECKTYANSLIVKLYYNNSFTKLECLKKAAELPQAGAELQSWWLFQITETPQERWPAALWYRLYRSEEAGALSS